jgi:hypothetical protein
MQNDGLSRSLAGAFLVLVMLLGSGANVVHAQDATPETGEAPVELVFVNALTSLEKVDVYINGDESDQRSIEGLDYGTTSDAIEGTAPGTVVVIRQNVPWRVDRDLFNTMIPTEPGKTYVVVISDFFVIPVPLDRSKTVIGEARSIGVHAAAEAPPVDVYASESSRSVPIGNLVPLIEDLQYGYSTAGGPVRTGSFDLRLTEAGTDSVVLEQDGIEIESDTSTVFVIIGKPGSQEQPLTVVSVSRPTAS